MLRDDQTQIPITKELREQLKSLGKKGQTYEDIIRMLIEKASPTNSDNTHTHEKKGITDIIEWIDQHNPTGITKREIERAIRETKGMDMRTINKYMPEVIREISNKGYRTHPKNNSLYIRYDISPNPE